MKQLKIHPYTRILLLVTGIAGCLLCNNVYVLLIFWLSFIFPMAIATNNFKTHIKFLAIAVLPMFIMLSFSYWLIVRDFHNYVSVLFTVLNIIICTSLIQIALIIPSEDILTTFRMWGLKKGALVTITGSYIVWVDIVSRADKIVTARFARGFIGKRTAWSKIKQLPHLLIPLIIGIMRTATERSASWEQKKMVSRIESMPISPINKSVKFNLLISLIALYWFLHNLITKLS